MALLPAAPTPQETIAKEASICSALADLGSARQAPLGARDYKAYVKTLLPMDLDEIRQACEQLALEERPEGGTAFPSLGTIVATMKRRKAEKLRLGPGWEEGTDVGPLINRAALDKVASYTQIQAVQTTANTSS